MGLGDYPTASLEGFERFLLGVVEPRELDAGGADPADTDTVVELLDFEFVCFHFGVSFLSLFLA